MARDSADWADEPFAGLMLLTVTGNTGVDQNSYQWPQMSTRRDMTSMGLYELKIHEISPYFGLSNEKTYIFPVLFDF
jgi:hypothetical protein